MNRFVAIFCSLGVCILSQGCVSSHKVHAPSVSPVKSNIDSASLASVRSSQEIKKFKTKAEQIDYKAIKALELF